MASARPLGAYLKNRRSIRLSMSTFPTGSTHTRGLVEGELRKLSNSCVGRSNHDAVSDRCVIACACRQWLSVLRRVS